MVNEINENKSIENTQPINVDKKPRGRPKKENKVVKSKDEIRAYYKEYFEEHKDEIMKKRAEYRKTDKYKQLRHEQNARYKAKLAQRPKVCLIDIKSLEPQRGVCLIKI
jgi:hypothetical protein